MIDIRYAQAYFKYVVVVCIFITVLVFLNYIDEETKANQYLVDKALDIYKMEIAKGIESDHLSQILSALKIDSK